MITDDGAIITVKPFVMSSWNLIVRFVEQRGSPQGTFTLIYAFKKVGGNKTIFEKF